MDGVKGINSSGLERLENNVRNIEISEKNEISRRKDETIDPKSIAEEFKENLEKLKKIFKGEAEFKIDKDTGMIVIKIKDKESGEIIRQIPPEVALRLAKNIEELIGVIFDERA
ncbi:flagellar protein FlaG [Thermosipho melanesiensis]|uniref:Flagellar protein FlaG protein n=2 Tax=Thermosipho melanesiensis TaxID=46541 RepID=A6LN43_THEM4|nr:flagellar protein FlaG [Thermosipho melanesiensis]ABR31344.1 flagellar protein FlaG protein [Thermosipho melanesiensis BI429]APT74404.1 flagellar protein FlaG [Thermosipho melanesiensis]OOC36367.1 flagellar protein FlaG [Thermosipho melanesiensis]OOC37185.1 flagellar protein FlaG [Thermosipho melanesiensis]OOC37937.1 flagellar protein FlaG [Thermosipho melanesiensis]